MEFLQVLADGAQMAGIIGRANFRIHLVALTYPDERAGCVRANDQTELRSAQTPLRGSIAADNCMHRKLIVAIETKIGQRRRSAVQDGFRNRKADEVMAIWTVTGAVFGQHR